MAHFNTGTATIDKALQIVKADKAFYHFIAWENPLFLEQSVYKEDFAQLREAIEKVFTTGEHSMAVYRVVCPDDSLHWVIADLTLVTLKNTEDVLQISIQAIDTLERELAKNTDTIHELSVYLDILDELFFKYDISNDRFMLFIGGEKQRVVLYEGTLESWGNTLAARNPFVDKYEEVFADFIEDMKTGTKHFSHEILLPNLIRGDSKELYLFKGRSIVDTSGAFYVLGCVYTIAKNSHRKKVSVGADAARDEMTGLLTKQAMSDYVHNAINSGMEGNCYLCILDVDNFKYVNDHFGHMFGDEVLITVADIIKEAVEGRGVAGRIGGDEMMLFLGNIVDRADLKSILRTIRTNVEWAYKGSRNDIQLSCSIGAASCPNDTDNYDDLFKIADKMLYRAKEGGKNRYIIYTPEIHGNVLQNSSVSIDAPPKGNKQMSKEHLLMEIVEQFLHRQTWRVQTVLEYVGETFDLSEVNVFYVEPVYQPMHWSVKDGVVEKMDLGFTQSVKFRALFGEDHLAVINHTADLEFNCPDAYAALKARNVNAALIYEMNQKIPGYIMFFKEGNSSRLWTESDKTYLNLIGKTIDLIIGGK